jgi:peroxiredoxin
MNNRHLFNRMGDPGDLRSMSRRRVCASLLLIGCVWAVLMSALQADAKDPKPFKSFRLKTLDGQKKMLADYTGKLTLVVFFYPQCTYCRVSLPHIQRMYDKYKNSGLSAVLINVVEEEDKLIPRYLQEHKINLPVLTGAWQPSLMRDYDLEATPTHVLLDSEGMVLLRQNGYVPGDEKALETGIVAALKISP